jgi:hypothetical protein
MTLSPAARRAALFVHVTVSVGWTGALLCYLALSVAAWRSQDPETVRGAWTAMDVTGWWVIVPLAIGSLVSGVVLSLGTRWGLFRYYWVLLAFILTSFAVLVLLLHMPSVSATADVARETSGESVLTLGGDLFHSGLGLVVLLTIGVLNAYKPSGMTPYGWRRQNRATQRG